MKTKYTATEWIVLVWLILGSINTWISLGFTKGFAFFLFASFVLFVFWCIYQILYNKKLINMKTQYTAAEWFVRVWLIVVFVVTWIAIGFVEALFSVVVWLFAWFVFWCIYQILYNGGIKVFYRKYIKHPEE